MILYDHKLASRAEALASIRKLDQRVRNLAHLERFYDVQTDQAAAATSFVELIATADAAASRLPEETAGVVMHNDPSQKVNYSTPSFESPDLALAFSTKWQEDGRDLLKNFYLSEIDYYFSCMFLVKFNRINKNSYLNYFD